MLGKQNIISEDEMNQIIKGLEGIKADIDTGRLEFTKESEDIHSFVEANLIERIGDAGKKLHTGRSRNDQVALDMKLYTRDEVVEMNSKNNGAKYRYLYARIYPFAKSTAYYIGTSYGCIF